MHAQIVNFHLADLSEDDYRALGAQLAPAYAELPGLLAKVWLADPATNTYGGVYLWRDPEDMGRYMESELLASVLSSPHIVDVTSKDFAVYDDLTAVTQPAIRVIADGVPA
jgi:hypothetical protein